MNRRDMIIVAVLMNTGLLAILFMMAMSTDDGSVALEEPKVQEIVAQTTPIKELSIPTAPPKSVTLSCTSPHDELDSVINAYATGAPPEPVRIDSNKLGQTKSFKVAKNEPAKEEAKFVEVTVKRGDSLDKIARANNTTIKALKLANSLTTDRLQIGQHLRVPVGTRKAVLQKSSAPAASISSKNTEYYTLKSGDNPWKIAKMFHVRFDELLKLNNLDEEKARRMKAGDRIRVR